MQLLPTDILTPAEYSGTSLNTGFKGTDSSCCWIDIAASGSNLASSSGSLLFSRNVLSPRG